MQGLRAGSGGLLTPTRRRRQEEDEEKQTVPGLGSRLGQRAVKISALTSFLVKSRSHQPRLRASLCRAPTVTRHGDEGGVDLPSTAL